MRRQKHPARDSCLVKESTLLTNFAKVTSTLKDTNRVCCFCVMLLLENQRICTGPNMLKNWSHNSRVSKGVEQEVQTLKTANSRLQKALECLWVAKSRTRNPRKNCKKSFKSNGIKALEADLGVDLAVSVDDSVNRRHSTSCSTTSMLCTTRIRSG